MKIFRNKLLLFFVFILAFAFPLDYYLCNHYFKDWKNVSGYQKDFWNLKQRNKQVGVAIFGTSRAFHNVNPGVLNVNANWLNFGADGTSHADHYLFLHEILKNNKIDTILLEVDEFTLSGWQTNTVPFKQYVFALRYGDPDYHEAFRDYLDRRKFFLWKLPLIRFMEYNNYYKIRPYGLEEEDRFQDESGFYEAFTTGFTNNNPDSLLCRVHPFDIKFLSKFISLAKENGSEVILFNAPIHKEMLDIEIDKEKSMSIIDSIANHNGIAFLDYSESHLIRDTSYFSDCTHLNRSGAEKFTKILYNKLNE